MKWRSRSRERDSFLPVAEEELWAPEAPLDNPEFKVSKDSVVVTYGGAAPIGDRHPLLQETVRLTVNGAISTILTLAP